MNIENSTNYNGKYFVLLGRLSPLDGIGPNEIGLDMLNEKLSFGLVKELILAVNYTVESDVTAHVISDIALKNSKISFSLAFLIKSSKSMYEPLGIIKA